jgi:hypothetical protein
VHADTPATAKARYSGGHPLHLRQDKGIVTVDGEMLRWEGRASSFEVPLTSIEDATYGPDPQRRPSLGPDYQAGSLGGTSPVVGKMKAKPSAADRGQLERQLMVHFVDEFGDHHVAVFRSVFMKSKWDKPSFFKRLIDASADVNGGSYLARAILAGRHEARRRGASQQPPR